MIDLFSRERGSRGRVSASGRCVCVCLCRPGVEGAYGEPTNVFIPAPDAAKIGTAGTFRVTAYKTPRGNRTISSKTSGGRDRIPIEDRLCRTAGYVTRWREEMGAMTDEPPPMWGGAVKCVGTASEAIRRLAIDLGYPVFPLRKQFVYRAFLSLSWCSGFNSRRGRCSPRANSTRSRHTHHVSLPGATVGVLVLL